MNYKDFEFINDSELGVLEKGLLATMLSLPDISSIKIDVLINGLPDDKKTVIKALNNLCDHGYVRCKSKDCYEASNHKRNDWSVKK